MTHGQFPFGRPNSERPLRPVVSGSAKALIIGVYPSAFHITWSPPPAADDREEEVRGRPYVASLAVDVEPTVFWDGQSPSPEELLATWKAAVGFRDSWGSARVGHNGPSGAGLLEHYLRPLELNPRDIAMTDAVPWYFVKQGAGSQGAAIERVNALSRKMALAIPAGDLPARPSPRDLVKHAVTSPRRESLRRELLETGAPLIITLGQEPLDAVRGVADSVPEVPEKLVPDRNYGSRGSAILDGRKFELLPLVHPGLLRQVGPDSDWARAHQDFTERVR